jgi:hypothetical protein
MAGDLVVTVPGTRAALTSKAGTGFRRKRRCRLTCLLLLCGVSVGVFLLYTQTFFFNSSFEYDPTHGLEIKITGCDVQLLPGEKSLVVVRRAISRTPSPRTIQ